MSELDYFFVVTVEGVIGQAFKHCLVSVVNQLDAQAFYEWIF
jgi:hypothetical protein